MKNLIMLINAGALITDVFRSGCVCGAERSRVSFIISARTPTWKGCNTHTHSKHECLLLKLRYEVMEVSCVCVCVLRLLNLTQADSALIKTRLHGERNYSIEARVH